MTAARGGMTLARVNEFLHLSGADREANEVVNAAGIIVEDERIVPGPGFSGWVYPVVRAVKDISPYSINTIGVYNACVVSFRPVEQKCSTRASRRLLQ